jgi:hypothetical protein
MKPEWNIVQSLSVSFRVEGALAEAPCRFNKRKSKHWSDLVVLQALMQHHGFKMARVDRSNLCVTPPLLLSHGLLRL